MADIRALRNAKARAWRIGIRQARAASHRWRDADQYQMYQAYDFRLFLEDSNRLIEKSAFMIGILLELRMTPFGGEHLHLAQAGMHTTSRYPHCRSAHHRSYSAAMRGANAKHEAAHTMP
ncbi:hypothetical protein [Xanthomonas translucens]|uniref:hypothetical protein n=1 Tax=Xanthomonas campestris pv. translucens TaxID=343 RepID=UPI0018C64197|nr:hypothetical protein [Xanthomonas translucens]